MLPKRRTRVFRRRNWRDVPPLSLTTKSTTETDRSSTSLSEVYTINVYRGRRTPKGCVVTVNNKPLPLRLDLRNHSPDGFEWGYGGSGPAQLALAILAFELLDHNALAMYQHFKRAIIVRLPKDRWVLHGDKVTAWACPQLAELLNREA